MTNQTPAATATTATPSYSLRYATGSCSRCGGSGHYSYNQISGTTCFKCHGAKTTLTPAGKKAKMAVDAFIAEHCTRRVADLQIGDVIRMPEGRAQIASVVPTGYVNSSTSNGVTVTSEQVAVTFTKPLRSQFGNYSTTHTSADATYVIAPAGAVWALVVAFARTLKTGVTIVDKTATA